MVFQDAPLASLQTRLQNEHTTFTCMLSES